MHVRLKGIGAVPQISPSVVDFPRESPFAVIPQHLRQKLKLNNNQQLWCYVGNAFTPLMDDSLDTIVGLTSINTSSDDTLIVTYSLVEAFG
ncbi:Ubiquitin-like protein [Pichia californica]|uniref:Ubiquitin-like protein ATG12 n=1 Tax=Pichia californica TaxID=460514 RepID=A0A9P7BFY3_9ASCO|nr:Ubiquitin-like protein [[Candida] californica]KAG0689401.1 Ubiquitin-like protein [[Candida] californica]